MRDVNAKILSMLLGFWAPDFAKDVAMGEDASRMTHEQAEQRVLGRGQLHFMSGACHDARGKIDNQVAALENGNLFFRPRLALRGA